MSANKAIVRLMLRIPAEIRHWLEAEAARTGASLNSEIVRAIREKMDRAADR